MSKTPSAEQIQHNRSLWKWFPLGHIDAIWHLVEHLSFQVGNGDYQNKHKYKDELEAVLSALQKLDEKIRADHYPPPKKSKRVK